MHPADVEETAGLLAFELELGIEDEPLACSDGSYEAIEELPSLKGFTKVGSGEVEPFYRLSGRKGIFSPWRV